VIAGKKHVSLRLCHLFLDRIASTASSARCEEFLHMSWRSVVCVSVCVFVYFCKNGWTDRDAVWRRNSRGGSRDARIRWRCIYGRYLVNMIERSLLGGHASCLYITLATFLLLPLSYWIWWINRFSCSFLNWINVFNQRCTWLCCKCLLVFSSSGTHHTLVRLSGLGINAAVISISH